MVYAKWMRKQERKILRLMEWIKQVNPKTEHQE